MAVNKGDSPEDEAFLQGPAAFWIEVRRSVSGGAVIMTRDLKVSSGGTMRSGTRIQSRGGPTKAIRPSSTSLYFRPEWRPGAASGRDAVGVWESQV